MVHGAPVDSERAGSAAPRPCVHGLDLAGRYRVGSLIRADGRCCTHHAHDALLRRPVSVTLATPETGFHIPRSLPLPTSARGVHGPGLGEIFDGGDDHGTLYLVIQAPEATTLSDELRHHHLTAGEVRDLGAGVARALLPAHRRGWTHGALDADTVGLGPDRVMVAGLGVGEWLAHWAHVEEPPRHPAPELLADREISPATDVFALGALLAEAAEPLPSEDPLSVLLRRMRADDPAGRPTTEEVLRLLTTPEPAVPPPSARVALTTRPTTGGASPARATAAALGGLGVAAALAFAVVVVGTPDASSDARGATLSALSPAPVLAAPLPLLVPPHPAEVIGGGSGAGAVLAAIDPAGLRGRALLAATEDEPTTTAVARPRDAKAGAPASSTTSHPARHEDTSAVERPVDHVRDSAAATATATTASTSPRARMSDAPFGSSRIDGAASDHPRRRTPSALASPSLRG